MPTKQNEEVRKWCETIKQAEEYRDEKLFVERWDTWHDWRRGETGGLPSQLLIWSLYKAFVPRVYFRDPYVVVRPTRPQMYFHAKLLERLDNILIRTIGVKKQIKRMIGNTWWKGIGVGKHGFDSQYGFIPPAEEEGEPQVTFADKEGKLIEYHQKIFPGYPWFIGLKPDCFVAPIGITDFNDSPWLGHWFIRHIDDAKSDPKYENAKDLQPNYIEKKRTVDSKRQKGLEEYVILYEIRDLKSGEILVFSMDHPDFLMKEKDVLQVGGLPFSTLIYNEDLEQVWGIPDSKFLEFKQLDLNEADQQITKHRRMTLLKFLYQDGTVEKRELEKLYSDTVMAGVKVKGNPGEAIEKFEGGIPPELFVAKDRIREDMRELVGFSKASSAGDVLGKTHLLKEEFVQAGAGTEIRINERGDMVADLVEDIVRKMNSTIFELWTEDHLVDIVGPDMVKYWVNFKGQDLKGEYTYEIDAQEAVPQSAELRYELAQKRFEALAPFAQPIMDKEGNVVAPPMIDRMELIRQYLEAQGPSAERLIIQQEQGPMDMQGFLGAMQGGKP